MEDLSKRINELIDISNKTPHSSDSAPFNEELLQLSEKAGNLYGQALAHINLSCIYQDMQQHEQYMESLGRAYEIAGREKYPDILIRYYNLEGIRYMQNYDEANALSMYLKGLHLALEQSDHSLCSVLYNNIAEIFYGNYDYDKAVLYYRKALEILAQENGGGSERFRKMFLENLISAYCFQGDLKNAKKCLMECRNIACADIIRPFALEEAELRVLMLENKRERALKDSLQLLLEVEASKVDDTLLFYTYSFLFDIFIQFRKRAEAALCLFRLDGVKTELSQNYVMETQKRKVHFTRIFDIENSSVYKEFYDLTLQWEKKNSKAASNSLSAAILLYETEKEKRLMKKERRNLEKYIQYDPLTAIHNRRFFDREVNASLQKEDVKELAYIMIDIDYFKEYNDHYGHSEGDAILKIVGALIKESLPDRDYVARFGGDEFVCLLINRNRREVEQFIKKIQHRLKEKKLLHVKAKNGSCLTLSFGAYYTRDKGIGIDTLVKRADDALYQVKNSGRNGYLINCDNQKNA